MDLPFGYVRITGESHNEFLNRAPRPDLLKRLAVSSNI